MTNLCISKQSKPATSPRKTAIKTRQHTYFLCNTRFVHLMKKKKASSANKHQYCMI